MPIDIQEGYEAIGGSIQKNQTYKQLSKDYKKLKKNHLAKVQVHQEKKLGGQPDAEETYKLARTIVH